MYAVKGSWIGQTFAMAKYSDSEGKKSRIRRSKDERKQMVVSFIKKYQSLNGGNFPSLNHTHKEVGGSFYIVREIVREIIQENKILGPGENNATNLSGSFPLGTISVEPEGFLSESSCGSSFMADRYQFLRGDNKLVGRQSFSDNGFVVEEKAISAEFCSQEINDNNEVSKPVEGEEKGVIKEDVITCLQNQANDIEANESLSQTGNVDIGNCFSDLSKEEVAIREQRDMEHVHMNCSSESNIMDEIASVEEVDSLSNMLYKNSEVVDKEALESLFGHSESQNNVIDGNVAPHTSEKIDVIWEGYLQQHAMGFLDGSFSASKQSSGNKETREGSNDRSSDVMKVESGTQFDDFSTLEADGAENLVEPLIERSPQVVNVDIESLEHSSLYPSISRQNSSTLYNNNGVDTATANLLSNESAAITMVLDTHGTIDPISENVIADISHSTNNDALLKDESEQRDEIIEETSKPKLDRIHIVTWQDSSGEQQIHPLLAIFKSFVSFLMRLFS